MSTSDLFPSLIISNLAGGRQLSCKLILHGQHHSVIAFHSKTGLHVMFLMTSRGFVSMFLIYGRCLRIDRCFLLMRLFLLNGEQHVILSLHLSFITIINQTLSPKKEDNLKQVVQTSRNAKKTPHLKSYSVLLNQFITAKLDHLPFKFIIMVPIHQSQ